MEDRYEIRDRIVQGGIGRTHRAYDHRIQREVAIKHILTTMDDPALKGGAAKQVMIKVEALTSLQHPHLVTMFDVGQDEDGPYVVMELINGVSLDEVIKNGPMTWHDFKQVALESLEVLLAAQDLNMIHGDLKPTNIMLTWLPSGNFQVKVVDFGLASLLQSQAKDAKVKIESTLDSIFFMPPEQFEGKPLDARSDLYSIGCVYYYALTGTYPFNGKTASDVKDAHIQHQVTPIGELRNDIPEWGCDLIMRLINSDPTKRQQSARETLSDFYHNDTISKAVVTHVGREIEPADLTAEDQDSILPTDTGSQQVSQAASIATPATPRFSKAAKRNIAIAIASVTLLGFISVSIMKRNDRVRKEWAYDNIMVLAATKGVEEIPMNAEQLRIVLERIAQTPGNTVITTPLKALVLAKPTDGTDIDIVIAKFATEAEMHADVRQKLFSEVIVKRRSASAIPIIMAYAKRTGGGRETLARLQQLNNIPPKPVPPVVTKPEPQRTPPPSQPAPKPQPSKPLEKISEDLNSNDEAKKIAAIAALGQSNDKSAHTKLLALVQAESNQNLRAKIFAASIAHNSKPAVLNNESQARQAWRQITWQTKTDEEKQAVVLALKDIPQVWATDLLKEFANSKNHPKASSMASEILAERES